MLWTMKQKLRLTLILAIISHFVFSQEEASILKISAWKEVPIPVCWENPSPTNQIARNWIKSAINNTWEKESGVKFSCWCECNENNSGIRIKLADSGAQTLSLGNLLDGKRNGMTLNYTFNSWNQRFRDDPELYTKVVAVHEFGHAIGFAHEHNRKECPNCDYKPQGTNGDWFIGPCDPTSVMNYCNQNKVYLNNGKLSEQDIKGAIALYGPPILSTSEQANKFNDVSFSDLSLLYTSRKLKRSFLGLFKSKHTDQIFVYITGSKQIFDDVQSVTYTLHDTFNPNKITVTNKSDRFGLKLAVYGGFLIKADVTFQDGNVRTYTADLFINDSSGTPLRKGG